MLSLKVSFIFTHGLFFFLLKGSTLRLFFGVLQTPVSLLGCFEAILKYNDSYLTLTIANAPTRQPLVPNEKTVYTV